MFSHSESSRAFVMLRPCRRDTCCNKKASRHHMETKPPIPSEGTRIDLRTWERRTIFEFFKGFSEPYHGVCIRLDCTETLRFAKKHRLSIFLVLVHRSLVAAHQVENFKTRIVANEVWRYEKIDAGSAIGRPNGTIGFGHYKFRQHLLDFVREATIEVERVKQRDDLERYPGPDLIRYSVLPWFDFTSISHARDFFSRRFCAADNLWQNYRSRRALHNAGIDTCAPCACRRNARGGFRETFSRVLGSTRFEPSVKT